MNIIGFTNESTVLTDVQVKGAMACLQAQVTGDYYPAYGLLADLKWLPKGQPPVPGQWQLIFADTSDQAGALGYHETTVNGDPIGFVFVKSDLADGTSWTVTASHELMEMLGDPDITTAEEQDNSDGSMTFRSKELCDACESDSFGYLRKQSDGTSFRLPDGTPFLYSDFVLPAYWNQLAPAGSKYDFGGHITAPLQILPGGYMGILQVPKTVQWGQVQADMTPGGKTIHTLSRRARRLTPARSWKHSER
jgi:hypothetical protein